MFGNPVIYLMFRCPGCSSVYSLNLSVIPVNPDEKAEAVAEAERICAGLDGWPDSWRWTVDGSRDDGDDAGMTSG